jgi:putative glutamine amidotransferase
LKPVIGLTCQNENLVNRSINKVNYTYINAVLKAGGLPIIIPVIKDEKHVAVIEEYLDKLDGIIFTGGEDVASQYFDEEPVKEVSFICHDRDITEMELFNKAYERGIPIFGICRGIQLLNIALGGDIYQDIYSQAKNVIGHSCGHNVQEGYHTIYILKDSSLYEIFKGEKLLVNSQHHQAVRKLGKDLRIIATTSDGIIEAVESTNDKFVLGVQFHPEAMAVKYDEFLKPFTYFVNKCKK